MVFKNRKQAGEILANKLSEFKNKNAVILALPRGGVPVAAEIAKTLQAPLDVLIVRKIGAPFQSELALGAICERGRPQFSESLLAQMGLEPEDLIPVINSEIKEVRRQIELFREGRKLASMAGKIVIVVDDGLATGATANAAVEFLKKMSPAKIIVAVPVGAASTARALRSKADQVIVLEEREDLNAVGQWYYDFSQVSDEEVISLLKLSQGGPQLAKPVEIKVSGTRLEGELTTFPRMKAVIIFAHGSGSSRKSPRNLAVAKDLNLAAFGTLLFDLLTDEESQDRGNVFDIEFLSQRLVAATRWLRQQPEVMDAPLGYFGASTGVAAALLASAKLLPFENVYSIVSRGGRPDLAGKALSIVKVPTLLLVGGLDYGVIELNQKAQSQLENSKLSIIPGATHLFDEPGTLEEVSHQAATWFAKGLKHKKNLRRRSEKHNFPPNH